jgi:hypothetical protein
LSLEAAQKKGIAWLFILFSALFALSLFSYFQQEDPIDIVKEQLVAIQNEQYTESYYAFSSPSFQEAISLEEFKHFIHNHPLISSAESIEFEKKKEKKGIDTIRVHFASSEGGNLTLDYQLIKQHNAWKILAIYESSKL